MNASERGAWAQVGAALAVASLLSGCAASGRGADAQALRPTSDEARGAELKPGPAPEGVLAAPQPQVRRTWVQAPTAKLTLPLAVGGRWRVEQGPRGETLHYQQGAEDVQLELRSWPARRSVRREQCEAELLLGRAELRPEARGELLTQGRLGAPEGFASWQDVWVDLEGTGRLLAVGAGVGRCFAAIAAVRGGEVVVGEWLRELATESLPQLRWLGPEALRAPGRAQPFSE